VTLAQSNPEAINVRFIERARVGVLFTALCVVLAIVVKGNVRTVPYEQMTIFTTVLRALLIVAVVVLARHEFAQSLLGRLGITGMISMGVLFAAATALINITVTALARLPFEQYVINVGTATSVALWALSVAVLLFGWLQTRLGQVMAPVLAALVVSCLFALTYAALHRSWILAACNAGYYSLSFVRWKTGSVGACAIALFLSQILLWLVYKA
jgi:membrane protease YdiL (CAAX protease family)